MLSSCRVLVLLACLACASVCSAAHAQTPEPREEIAMERIEQLGDSKPMVVDRYRQALALLDLMAAAGEREQSYREATRAAAGKLASIQEELSEPAPPTEEPDWRPMAVEEVASARDEASRAVTTAKDEVAALRAEDERRQTRRLEIAERLEELDGKLDAAVSERESAESESDAELRAAMLFLADISDEAIAAERAALQAELESYDARRELLPARRDLSMRSLQTAEQSLGVWQDALASARERVARETARDTEAFLERVVADHPRLKPFAEEVRQLAVQLARDDRDQGRLNNATDRLALVEGELESLRSQYRAVRRRMEASGLNRATGMLLRRQYQSLPEVRLIEQRVRSVDRALENVELSLVELQEARERAGDLDAAVEEILRGVPDAESVRASARELAIARRDLLDEVIARTLERQSVLTRLAASARELLEAARAYSEFVRERILWVRSIPAGEGPRSGDFARAAEFFSDVDAWRQTMVNSWQEFLRRPVVPGVLVLLVVGLFELRRRSAWIHQHVADRVGRFRTDRVHLSFLALGIGCLAGAAPSLLIWTVGWWIASPVDQPLLGVVAGSGLQTAGIVLFPLMVLRELLGADGLADAHFRWPEKSVRRLRRGLTRFAIVAIPAIAVTVAADVWGEDRVVNTVGRIGFTVVMLAAAWFIYAMVRPTGVVLGPWLREHPKSWVARLGRVWFGALVSAPLLLVVLAWLGYFYTAVQLQNRVRLTLFVVVVLVLMNAMLNRWLFVARRRVAYEDARRRRDQAVKDQADAIDDDAPSEVAPIDEMKIDIPAMSEQTRQLFRTALLIAAAVSLFFVWSPVLPALRQLDRVQIYPESRYLEASSSDVIPQLETQVNAIQSKPLGDQPASDAEAKPPAATNSTLGIMNGSGGTGESEAISAISLADVGLALVFLTVTYVAFRNVPAVFEILLLQRLPLDAGSRYAISTVLRYAIAIVGVSAAAAALHLSWSNIQWLAAALTFGLAFGLQEIFANFVSGLIILGERPVRIGDTVTVGNVTGTVSKIKMRATTITDWDRKELIIPNRSFITDQVINWTLSDPTLRVSIPVGVGYGEDVRLAEETLLRVAAEQPVVLENPKPHVLFGGFGDSTLDFQLRVFIPHIEHLITVRHDMHMRITEAFREAGIEIAFPQRDLHIKSMPDLRGVERAGGETGKQ